MTTDNGGPAFPCEFDLIGTNHEAATGMSLRDYFAAIAMRPLREATKSDRADEIRIMAREAYVMADAMLRARSES